MPITNHDIMDMKQSILTLSNAMNNLMTCLFMGIYADNSKCMAMNTHDTCMLLIGHYFLLYGL
jgi:hypothetical protein